ncbi:Gfo/Idh/MocA family protein [Candidatus Neomarinimicrobiota bacterium]
MKKEMPNPISRKKFISTTAAAAAAFTIIPRRVLGGQGFVPPSEKINLAMIGVGGQGNVDLGAFLGMTDVQVVAVADPYRFCDYSHVYFGGVKGWEPTQQRINENYASAQGMGSYSGCEAYVDFYELLEEESDIDAISVATTDNLHAFAAMAGIRRGKHVYCQKPLTHDIWEARQLTLAAREAGVITQMGNQGHAGNGNRQIKEWVQDGAIGNVYEVHIWTNRPIDNWPQGVGCPAETMPVPDGLDWDRWIGPAPYRPYNEIYLPFYWRGRIDFGTGVIGDMACHLMDTPHYVLDLPHPDKVQATSTPIIDNETYPSASLIDFEFPSVNGKPRVNVTWYDGGLKPKRPEVLEDGRRMPTSGVIMVGDRGSIMCSDYGNQPRIIPETAMQAYQTPTESIPRIQGGIYRNFIDGIRTGVKPTSNFDVSGPLTEFGLLGNFALFAQNANMPLEWDADAMRVTNYDAVNRYVRREYREGWRLDA